MKKHLAIFSGSTIFEILVGRKTIDCRLSKFRIPPFGQVAKGDLVYLKPPGQPIVGQFTVDQAIFFDSPGDFQWQWIRRQLMEKMAISEKFLEDRKEARYLTLIWIGPIVSFLTPPMKIVKRDRRPWVVLN